MTRHDLESVDRFRRALDALGAAVERSEQETRHEEEQ